MRTRSPDWSAVSPGRFAATIRTDGAAGCAIALLGLPDDLGVRLNHGRPGAAEGPRAFRETLAKFGSDFDAIANRPIDGRVFDAGDVEAAAGEDAAALEATHARVTDAARELQRLGLVTVGIGGGHDLTFPMVRALAQERGGAVGGVNVDPHLDVRETVGSGMPYRRLIEGGHVNPKRFVELGAGRFSNLREHLEWAKSQGVTIIPGDDVLEHERAPGESLIDFAFRTAFPAPNSVGFVSIDLDVIDGSQAPGVSAVNPSGFPVRLVCDIARRAGADARVRHFDIMELSPAHDEPCGAGRTARVAALIFLHFVAGFAERKDAAT